MGGVVLDVSKMQALIYEIRNLKNKCDIYTKNNGYVYTNVYIGWINEYNSLLHNYNALSELRISSMTYDEHDLSSTQKTVRVATIEYFSTSIEALC